MAWTRLTNSTTADANDVHDNFVETRSGSLLPMKLSTTAAQTTGAYDLGSTTKRWKDLWLTGAISRWTPHNFAHGATYNVGTLFNEMLSYFSGETNSAILVNGSLYFSLSAGADTFTVSYATLLTTTTIRLYGMEANVATTIDLTQGSATNINQISITY